MGRVNGPLGRPPLRQDFAPVLFGLVFHVNGTQKLLQVQNICTATINIAKKGQTIM